ncbi:MAG: hypothetical protein JO256_14830 [Alphaproteobacteria bacterium]|nr:hypothetical protein [Alphaproteobacteria bacterium]
MAVLVMFVEWGLMSAILRSQAGLASLIDGDLVLMNSARDSLHEWTRIAPVRISQAAAVPGIAYAAPVFQSGMLLRNPPDLAVHRIVAFGISPEAPPLKFADPAVVRRVLARPDAVLFDKLSRNIYGPVGIGHRIELDGRPFEIAGTARVGPDIVMDGSVVMSDGAWRAREPDAWPVMGVLRVVPKGDLAKIRTHLRAALPDDVSVITVKELWWREVFFTFRAAPIGIIFGVGVAAGALIGGIVCYQILFNEVMDLRRELSTLRAMGFGARFFRRLILEQTYLLTAMGFLAGFAAAFATYRFLAATTGLAMVLDWRSALAVAIPAAMMGHLGGIFALRHLSGFAAADVY